MSDIDAKPRSFDPAVLREKYREERIRRIRPEGNKQYRRIEGELSHFLDDPYVEPGFTREPVAATHEVAIIGGGFGGQLMAARLLEAGIDDLRIIEAAGDFGGAWYWNRYPGLECDIESYIYLPLLEELGVMPTTKYASGVEIFEHAKAIGRHYGLYEKTLFQTEVKELRWDDVNALWVIRTSRNDDIRARFVLMSTGLLHRPKLPGIPGIETFKGHAFHASRWDYDYTGGDPSGGLTGLADKRVGIIGTGATAVQCISHLGKYAKQLYVFQRTPTSSIGARGNLPTDPDWASHLKPGWQKERRENFNTIVSGGQQEVDLVSDGWTETIRKLGKLVVGGATAEDMSELRQLADFEKMEELRGYIGQVVKDHETAEALKPWFNQFCKRPCFLDNYLETFNRPNVKLVDTKGHGVERITEHGVIAEGIEYEIDCLIYATGFEISPDIKSRLGYEIYGRNGLSQSEAWKDGVTSFHGIFGHNFPNRFILGSAQQGNTPNFIHMHDEIAQHLAYVIRYCKDHHIRAIEPSAQIEQEWLELCLSFAEMRRAFDEECTPSYYNNEGHPTLLAVRNGFYGGGSNDYLQRLKAWRDAGTLPGFDLELEGQPERQMVSSSDAAQTVEI